MRSPQDTTTAQVAAELQSSVQALEAVPFMSGTAIRVTLTSGSGVRVRHGLGRKPVGYLVLRLFNAAGYGYHYAPETAMDSQFLTIHAASYTTNPDLLLWFF